MKKLGFSILAAVMLVAICFTSVFASDMPFTDVKEGSWYYDYVALCYENGYMTGVSNTEFGPKVTLSRAQLATIISSIEGIDDSAYTNQIFSDVPNGKWYFTAVNWAQSCGIVAGYDNGTFGPNDDITREQLAVMLYAYANYKNFDVGARVDDLNVRFSGDADRIHDWAYEALSWAVANEIITGTTDTTINPRGSASRAEAATMIYKFALKFIGSGAPATDFTVSRAFGDGMVVQRDEKLAVWGFAAESENGNYVDVTFKGQTASARIVDGQWKAVFNFTFSADATGSDINVIGANKTITISDVLVGDVYYVIGQSNVDYNMTDLKNALTEAGQLYQIEGVEFNDDSNIRLFRNSNRWYIGETGENAQGTATVFEDVKSELAYWQKPSEGGSDFSALAYLFADRLATELQIPVGMIEIDASGAPLTSFTPNELAQKWDSDYIDEATGIHYMKLGSIENGNFLPFQLPSRFVYNQQIHPLKNFSCAGIVWYQGESDFLNTINNYGKDEWTFATEFADLMNYFRANFGNSDFPVYMIEFPACFNIAAGAAYLPTGHVRAELGSIPAILEDSYVVPSSDLWKEVYWQNNIHPYCKPGQAKRLAEMVLANEYGIGDMEYVAGPTLESVEYVDEYTAVLTFNYVGDGIYAFSDDESGDVYGLQVLVANDNYYDDYWVEVGANVEFTAANEITITFDQPIYGVRYNALSEYYFYTNANLCNSKRVPMVAFADYKD